MSVLVTTVPFQYILHQLYHITSHTITKLRYRSCTREMRVRINFSNGSLECGQYGTAETSYASRRRHTHYPSRTKGELYHCLFPTYYQRFTVHLVSVDTRPSGEKVVQRFHFNINMKYIYVFFYMLFL